MNKNKLIPVRLHYFAVLNSMVPAIFIQSIESNFVYEFYYINDIIDTLLYSEFLPKFFITTNNDCLGMNYLYSLLLVPLVQAFYNNILSES